MTSDRPIRRWFLDHPASVGESYLEHMGVATRFGAKMLLGGVACIAHGLVPALFVRTGSQTVKSLYDDMRSRQPDAARRAAYEEPEWQLEYEI